MERERQKMTVSSTARHGGESAQPTPADQRIRGLCKLAVGRGRDGGESMQQIRTIVDVMALIISI